MLDLRATAASGLTMAAFALVMALVALARQEENPWLLVLLVGAVAYTVTFAVVRSRS